MSVLTGAFLRLLNGFLRFLCQFVDRNAIFSFLYFSKKGQTPQRLPASLNLPESRRRLSRLRRSGSRLLPGGLGRLFFGQRDRQDAILIIRRYFLVSTVEGTAKLRTNSP